MADQKPLLEISKGFVGGTLGVHGLTSFIRLYGPRVRGQHLESSLGQRIEFVKPTKLELIAAGATAAAEILGYYLLARKGFPAYYVPLALNAIDLLGRGIVRRVIINNTIDGMRPDDYGTPIYPS